MTGRKLISAVAKCAALTTGILLGMSVTCRSLAAQMPFANYNIFVPTGPTSSDVVFVEGPHPVEFGLPSPADPALPGWDANAVASDSLGSSDPPTLDESTLILTLPVYDTVTYSARDTEGNELGQLSVLAVGSQLLDLNASNAVIDDVAGTIQVTAGPNVLGWQPPTFSVVDVTGIYASDVHVLNNGLAGYAAGHFLLPIDDDPSTTIQDNILNAWNSGAVVGADVRGIVTGNYVREPSSLLESLMGTLSTMDLPNGISTALDTKLDNSLKLWQSENQQSESSIHKLEQFVHFVGNHDGTKITPSDADVLVDSANEIIGAMEAINLDPADALSSSASAVPEPSGMVLVLFGFAALGVWHRIKGRP